MIRSPMGPGFFLFFPRYAIQHKPPIPPALRWRTMARVRRNLAFERKREVQELITPAVVEKVTETVVKATNTKSIERTENVDPAAAERYLREFVRQYIEQIQQDEIALILIMANV